MKTSPASNVTPELARWQEIEDKYAKEVFQKKKHVHRTKFFAPDPSTLPGVTNAPEGEVSAQTNLQNACVKLDPDGEYFHVYSPDGTERCYRVSHHQKHSKKDILLSKTYHSLDYILQWEKSLSGHTIYYGYDKEDRINVIRSAANGDSKTYASASFNYHEKHSSKNPNFDV